jgi:hypothetical protein
MLVTPAGIIPPTLDRFGFSINVVRLLLNKTPFTLLKYGFAASTVIAVK